MIVNDCSMLLVSLKWNTFPSLRPHCFKGRVFLGLGLGLSIRTHSRCTYEVGTFLRDKKQKPILVIPVKLAVIFSVFSLAELLIMGGYFASASITLETESTENEFQQLISFYLFFSIFYAPALPVLFFLGIGMMSDLTDLPRQLREFRVQDAKCFCCSNQHRHPDTGETLPCDRELMFHTLKKWFGKEEDLHDEHLETFNQLVHKDLAPQVLQSVASDVLPFSYSFWERKMNIFWFFDIFA